MVWQGDAPSISLHPGRLPGGCVASGTIKGRKGNLKGLKHNLCHMKANRYLGENNQAVKCDGLKYALKKG